MIEFFIFDWDTFILCTIVAGISLFFWYYLKLHLNLSVKQQEVVILFWLTSAYILYTGVVSLYEWKCYRQVTFGLNSFHLFLIWCWYKYVKHNK